MLRCATVRRGSGVGNCALAYVTARDLSPLPRRSCALRSMPAPQIPQNLNRASFTWPQEWQTISSRLSTLLSAFRRSTRTPHIPQNRLTVGFSAPQKVQIMSPTTPFKNALLDFKTAALLSSDVGISTGAVRTKVNSLNSFATIICELLFLRIFLLFVFLRNDSSSTGTRDNRV